jgi:hypothetical protein
MSEDKIWSYLTYQSTLETEYFPEGWCAQATSFQSYLRLADVFSTKCQFINIGKVTDFRDKHPELKPWRSGYLCFYSLNFAFEAKNIELIVALKQLLLIPHSRLIPHVAKYNGTKKKASDDMDRYFNQYNNHVLIKGIHFVIIHQHDIPYVRQFFRKTTMDWVDHQYETWERIRPSNLISDDD